MKLAIKMQPKKEIEKTLKDTFWNNRILNAKQLLKNGKNVNSRNIYTILFL
jgi:hypothetical protein